MAILDPKSSRHRWLVLIASIALAACAIVLFSHHFILGALSAAGCLFFGVNWFTGHSAVSAYREVIDRQLLSTQSMPQGLAYQVRRQLTRLKYDTQVENEGSRALVQLKSMEAHFQHFEKSLAQKLQPEELTYNRYHAAGLKVFDGVLENLSQAASLIGQQSLAQKVTPSDRLLELLDLNDQAIAGMERINESLEQLTGSASPARLQAAMSDLESLAQQAHKYAASGE
jgi:hypothetical protein